MYATSTHVQQVHHPPPYNQHNQVNGNGHAHPHQANGNSHHQTPPSTQSHRSTPSTAAKEPIVVVGIPSVSIQNNQLQVGNSQSSQCRLSSADCYKRVGLSPHFPHRLDAFVHPSQGAGRWIIWYCLVVRLAWDATPQYTFIPHAMWSWS
jgi:hypothetical protein